MPRNVFIASSVKAIAAKLLNICKNYDINVAILKDPVNIVKELKEARFDLIFIDYNLVDIIKNDLIAIQANLNNITQSFMALITLWAKYRKAI